MRERFETGKIIRRVALVLCAVALASCSEQPDATSDCPGGQTASVSETTYCVHKQPITETGFECPDGFPNLVRETDEFSVCAQDEGLPEDHERVLEERFGEARQSCVFEYSAIDDCAEPGPFDACAWARRADAMVYGEIVDLRAVDRPKTVQVSTHEGAVNTCTGAEESVVDLDLAVERVLWGSVEDSHITVRFDSWTLLHHSLAPGVDAQGDFSWHTNGASGCSPQVGQEIGLPLFFLGELDLWAPFNSVTFVASPGASGQSLVNLESRLDNRCQYPDPAIEQMTLDDLAGTLSSCQDTTAAQDSREQVRTNLFEDKYHLPRCFPENQDDYACEQTADCPHADESCVDGSCRVD